MSKWDQIDPIYKKLGRPYILDFLLFVNGCAGVLSPSKLYKSYGIKGFISDAPIRLEEFEVLCDAVDLDVGDVVNDLHRQYPFLFFALNKYHLYVQQPDKPNKVKAQKFMEGVLLNSLDNKQHDFLGRYIEENYDITIKSKGWIQLELNSAISTAAYMLQSQKTFCTHKLLITPTPYNYQIRMLANDLQLASTLDFLQFKELLNILQNTRDDAEIQNLFEPFLEKDFTLSQ